jgi:hypothetical protein
MQPPPNVFQCCRSLSDSTNCVTMASGKYWLRSVCSYKTLCCCWTTPHYKVTSQSEVNTIVCMSSDKPCSPSPMPLQCNMLNQALDGTGTTNAGFFSAILRSHIDCSPAPSNSSATGLGLSYYCHSMTHSVTYLGQACTPASNDTHHTACITTETSRVMLCPRLRSAHCQLSPSCSSPQNQTDCCSQSTRV